MTQATPPNLAMPPRHQIVAEVVARLDTAGLRSGLLDLDTATLIDLGLQLTDRKVTVRDAANWLNAELGGTPDEPVVPERNVYRFADHFRRLYGQARSEHARRIARLRVDQATDGSITTMARVGTQRLVDLVTERLVESDSLEDMSASEINAAINTIDGIARQQAKQAELALKQAEGHRRAARLEADLAKLHAQLQEMQAREAGRRQAAETARRQVEQTSEQAGGVVTRQQVLEILDAVMRGDA